MIRVGFIVSSDQWLGGRNYLRNLFQSIYSLPDRKIDIVIFSATRDDQNLREEFSSTEIIRTKLLDRYSPLNILRKTVRFFFSMDPFLERLLIKHKISVLSHSGYLGKNAKIPAIGWIPDFQHIHLPKFFTNKEISMRNKHFMKICRYCTYVLLSSYDAQKDLCRFAPQYEKKSIVLRFVGGPIIENNNIPEIFELEKCYQFKMPYFYMPNQFWAHKNHRIIIDALNILIKKNADILVLTTGDTVDQRQPNYFNCLMDYARQCGVLKNFKVLGIVPYEHVISLAQNALALINPSLFEGWSTSVEEAKTLGKRIILSDIPIHREQSPPGGIFFNPKDAISLADIMLKLWDTHNLKNDYELVYRAQQELPRRIETFARIYEDIIISGTDY